jgi:hypothetical protein
MKDCEMSDLEEDHIMIKNLLLIADIDFAEISIGS